MMDSDRSSHKRREKNRRKLSTDLKFDSLGLNLRNSSHKSNSDLRSNSNYSVKKFTPVIDSDFKHWAIVSEGFPPGTTVDELKKYGRRRLPSYLQPEDHIRVDEGVVQPYKSEYKRRFKVYEPSDYLLNQNKSDLNKENSPYKDLFFFMPEYKLSYINYPRKRPVMNKPPNNLEPLKDYPMEFTTEKNSQYIYFPNSERRKLLRRSTALKLEGEMSNETEIRKEYRMYPNVERPQMVRHLPSLKLEGEFESMTTEQQDKYITFLLNKRPIIEKKKTLLKMEGDLDFLTEKNMSYVPHEPHKRPPIRKRSTSLKLDGELEFIPEYRESFIDFTRTRPVTYKPSCSLRNVGELEQQTEMKTQFVNYNHVDVPQSAKPENNLHMEGEMEILPEYKLNYVDFPRERPLTRRPLNQIKPGGNLQVLSESSERFSELPAIEKPEITKRESNIKLEGTFDFVTEQSDKFKKPESVEKTELVRNTPNLTLEGNMDLLTEKADKFGFLRPEKEEKENNEKRPSSLKMDREFLFLPDPKISLNRSKSPDHKLKPIYNFRSNPSSPRKKPKEKIKFNLEDDKKFILGTPKRRLSAKRLKENAKFFEKNLKFNIPTTVPERHLRETNFNYPDRMKIGDQLKLDDYLSRTTPKNFEAFQVLDVKGRLGCQTCDKMPSDDEFSTYRLEVSNPEKPDFLKNDWNVFPTPAVNAELREEAEKKARKRAETFEKIVKSPEVANYLLEENNNIPEINFRNGGKLSPLPPADNFPDRSFVVLNGTRKFERQIKEPVKKNKRTWEMPEWLSSSPIT